ncbi:MAG: LysR family transcriptional regulator [Rhodospirillaceae bacterium]|nr:LysR family transcriptional regulator [Rhodospirillaceae bacterium]
MELRQISHFLCVAEYLSFSAAAEDCGLTTQAVSKSVRQLEQTLGVKLFDRDTRTVSLTTFGNLLLPHAQAIQAETKQFGLNLETALGAHTGTVRLGATPTALTQLVPRALKRLFDLRPTLRVEVERSDFEHLTPLLLRGDLDLIVSTAPTKTVDSLITIEPLMTDYNIIVCSADNALAKKPLKPKALLNRQWVTVNFPRGENDLKALFSSMGEKLPSPSLQTTATDFAIDWVSASNFLSILPAQIAAGAVADGRLSAIEITDLGDPWPIVMAYRRNATRSPAALALIDALKIEAA